MRENPPELRRLLLGAWSVALVVVCLWLGVVLWLGHVPEHWPESRAAWWSGDRIESRPLIPMRAELVSGELQVGAEVVSELGGNKVFRLRPTGAVRLGRFVDNCKTMTFSFWFRVEDPGFKSMGRKIEIASISSSPYRVQFSLLDGKLAVGHWFPEHSVPGVARSWVRTSGGEATVGPDVWHQAVWVTDAASNMLVVDGQVVVKQAVSSIPGPGFADFVLSVGPWYRRWEDSSWPVDSEVPALAQVAPDYLVDFDDVVLFDRALSGAELAALWRSRPG